MIIHLKNCTEQRMSSVKCLVNFIGMLKKWIQTKSEVSLMLRSFIVFLMLIVVFLGGMLVGIDRGQIAVNHDDKQEVEISAEQNENKQKKDKERIVEEEVEENDKYLTDSDEPM